MARAEVLHWTPIDYLGDHKTWGLTLEEHGAYCLLLWHMWTSSDEQSTFPLDYKALATIWRVPVEEAERLVDVLSDGPMAVVKVKPKRGRDVLFSKRLAEQARAARVFSETQAEKGRKSGAVRRAKARTTVEQRFDAGSTTDEPTCRVSRTRNTYPVCVGTPTFDEAYKAFPNKGYRPQSKKAWESKIAEGKDPADLYAACASVTGYDKSMSFFLADDVWERYVPAAPSKPCMNPDCINGHVLVDGIAHRCPECAS